MIFDPVARANLAGFAAIGMWALLALFTDASGAVPPFQLAAMTFGVGCLVCWIWQRRQNATAPHKGARHPIQWRVAIIGSLGLFGYHALYFTALRNAPPIEASLIAYLWPLLIVVGSGFLPGGTLGWHHIVGALMGFAGTALIVTGGDGFSVKAEFAFGYGIALVAAFTWTAYSLGARRFANVDTSVVIIYCGLSALMAFACHLVFEQTVWPDNSTQWMAIIALGLLPVGVAFYVWDHAMKHGDVALVGAASYCAPLLSSIILIVVGGVPLTWVVGVACLLITAGALLAAKNMLRASAGRTIP